MCIRDRKGNCFAYFESQRMRVQATLRSLPFESPVLFLKLSMFCRPRLRMSTVTVEVNPGWALEKTRQKFLLQADINSEIWLANTNNVLVKFAIRIKITVWKKWLRFLWSLWIKYRLVTFQDFPSIIHRLWCVSEFEKITRSILPRYPWNTALSYTIRSKL